MRYVWPGNISLEIPNGWQLREPGDVLELEPPSRKGAMHISILDRERGGTPTEEEARELAEWFLKRRGGDGKIAVLTGSDRIPIAQVAFAANEDGVPISWTVFTKVWPGCAVLASFNAEPGFSKDLGEADAIFKSIQLAA